MAKVLTRRPWVAGKRVPAAHRGPSGTRMISPTQLTVLAVGMLLLAYTGSPWAGLARACPGAPPASATPLISSPPPPGETDSQPPQPRAYLFRGALGPIFSRGMDR